MYRNRKGSMLIQIVIALFFLGIMSITFLPILTSSIKSFQRIKLQNEMIFIGEMIIEKIKSEAAKVSDISTQIELNDKINYEDEDFDCDRFNCYIHKIESSSDILEFSVRVENKNDGSSEYIEFKASIPKS